MNSAGANGIPHTQIILSRLPGHVRAHPIDGVQDHLQIRRRITPREEIPRQLHILQQVHHYMRLADVKLEHLAIMLQGEVKEGKGGLT